VRSLSAEAGGKGSTKKDLNSQRNLFKDVLEFLEVLICSFPLESYCLCAFVLISFYVVRMATLLKSQWRLVEIHYKHQHGLSLYRFLSIWSFVLFSIHGLGLCLWFSSCVCFFNSWTSWSIFLVVGLLSTCRLVFLTCPHVWCDVLLSYFPSQCCFYTLLTSNFI
jgi:hypothetical protein